jgi:two-component system response regulator HydG
MNWQLMAGRGLRKGAAWVVRENALLIGRAKTCDVPIPDPAVSRQHCRVVILDGRLILEDLDSSNSVLVNGVPVRRCELCMGDEIAVGSATLLVAQSNDELPKIDTNLAEGVTISLAAGEPIFLRDDLATTIAQGNPQTVHELAMLYQLGRTLSEADTVEALRNSLMERIRTSFQPGAAWIIEVDAFGEMGTAWPSKPKLELFHHEIISRALHEKLGLVTGRRPKGGGIRDIVTTMVAPAVTAGKPAAVMIAEATARDRTYDENDLALFMSVAQVAAPYVHSVARVAELRTSLNEIRDYAGKGSKLLGDSEAITHVRDMIRRIAPSQMSVLLLGETGTGKELAAAMLHECSTRANSPFIVVNCAAIPPDLFESEMFGHEKGAFTGATTRRRGRCEQAHGGTLFLDEIGDLTLDNQARILRVLELGKFHRVGGEEQIEVDFRIVTATNKDIHGSLLSGAFRPDLYHRINGVEIHMPPLRSRKSDIAILAEHFLKLYVPDAPRRITGLSPAAIAYLQEQMWPGNVRELRMRIQRAIHLGAGSTIEVDDLLPIRPMHLKEGSQELSSLDDVERRHIEAALVRCEGNISAAARMLGIHRNTLHLKMQQYGLKL